MNLPQSKSFHSQQRPPRQSEEERLRALTAIEEGVKARGFMRIAGIDEAGRGPLAGPVTAAACLFLQPLFFPGINDSKLLSPKRREELFSALTEHPDVRYSVVSVSPERIDEINILQATLEAMRLAVETIEPIPDYLLVDGVHLDIEIPAERLIKGDQRSQLIAAASILAKVSRDRMMSAYDKRFPEYGFAKHKGYGTRQHLEAISKHGLTEIHRRSFRPKAFA